MAAGWGSGCACCCCCCCCCGGTWMCCCSRRLRGSSCTLLLGSMTSSSSRPRSLSCSLRSLSFSACSTCALRAFSLSSFSRAARRNCSKLSLEDFTADNGVDVDFCARLAHEPIFFSFTSWTFLGAMGALASCLNLSLSCREGGGPLGSEERMTGRKGSMDFTFCWMWPGGQGLVSGCL